VPAKAGGLGRLRSPYKQEITGHGQPRQASFPSRTAYGDHPPHDPASHWRVFAASSGCVRALTGHKSLHASAADLL
jgi:hypothetical protein